MPLPTLATERILQEYLQARADTPERSEHDRARHLLTSYAEFRFHVAGGSRCPMCHAHVRHVLPVAIVQLDGERREFPCLCFRCVEGERTNVRAIEIGLGDAKWILEGRLSH